MNGELDFPTRVIFGAGRVRELPVWTQGWGRQALIVTDHGVVGSGALERVQAALAGSELDFRVFDEVESNPTGENVLAGARRFREGCDFVIAVGGGSVMDAA